MISIQDNPRFKRDCERYNRAIKECSNDVVKAEIKSLYEQFLNLIKELDSSVGMLISERIINTTQQSDTKTKLYTIRTKLEEKIAGINQK
jgi:hypothetical protein